MGLDKQQLYSSNSNIKYPFDDTHEYDVPDNIVLDMSLSVPDTVNPIITAISVTPTMFFMAIEDSVSGLAVGHVAVSRPYIFRIYEMTATMDGSFGWVVLGPGKSVPYENRKLDLEPDQTIVLKKPTSTSFFDTLEIDGFSYEDITGSLKISVNNPYIRITEEDRVLTGIPGGTATKKCLVLSRDDGNVPLNTIYGGFTESTQQTLSPATSIGGVSPDIAYNVDIESPDVNVGSTLDITTGGTFIGLLLHPEAESTSSEDGVGMGVCNESNPLTKIKHGRCDEGIDIEDGLPLDSVVEGLKPQYLEEDCGCDDESTSE